jgi:hypothetical protein
LNWLIAVGPTPSSQFPAGGVALEVAVQLARARGDRQAVAAAGVVVHADGVVAMGAQQGVGGLQHGDPLLLAR